MGLDTRQGEGERRGQRLALSQREAASALGVSVDCFAEHIAPDVRRIRCGRRWLYPVKELERWVELNAVLWGAA